MIFKNRVEAGVRLAKKLGNFKGRLDTVVLGLPRGGVVVAAEVAKSLDLQLDVVVPRKIGAPGAPELALGAVTEEGDYLENQYTMSLLELNPSYIGEVVEKELIEAKKRLAMYRMGKPPLDLKNKTAIIVDDGVATGATMKAAIVTAKNKRAREIVAAVPVISPEVLSDLLEWISKVVFLAAPEFFAGVGEFYEEFDQVTDDEVIGLLLASR